MCLRSVVGVTCNSTPSPLIVLRRPDLLILPIPWLEEMIQGVTQALTSIGPEYLPRFLGEDARRFFQFHPKRVAPSGGHGRSL